MSMFDDIQKSVFNSALDCFGDEAYWVPSDTSISPQTALVLYNCPNDPVSIGSDKYQYRPYNYSFEYYVDEFVGLKESVDSGVIEKVSVKGDDLAIRQVVKKFDGKTFVAYGEIYG